MGERGAPRPRLGEATEKGKQILKSGLEILKDKKRDSSGHYNEQRNCIKGLTDVHCISLENDLSCYRESRVGFVQIN